MSAAGAQRRGCNIGVRPVVARRQPCNPARRAGTAAQPPRSPRETLVPGTDVSVAGADGVEAVDQGVEVAVARPCADRQPQVGRPGDRPQQHRALGKRRDDVRRLVSGRARRRPGRSSRPADRRRGTRRRPAGARGRHAARRPARSHAGQPPSRPSTHSIAAARPASEAEIERPRIEPGRAGAHVPDDAVGIGEVARERRPQALVVASGAPRAPPSRSGRAATSGPRSA